MNTFQQERQTLSIYIDKVEYLLIPALAAYMNAPTAPSEPILGKEVKIGDGLYTMHLRESKFTHRDVQLVFTDATTGDEKNINIPMDHQGGYISLLKEVTSTAKGDWWTPEVFDQVKGLAFNQAVHNYINGVLAKRHFHGLMQQPNSTFIHFVTMLVNNENGITVKVPASKERPQCHVKVIWSDGVSVMTSESTPPDFFGENHYGQFVGQMNNHLTGKLFALATLEKLYLEMIVKDKGTFKLSDVVYHRNFGLRSLRERLAMLRRQEIMYYLLEDSIYNGLDSTIEKFEYYAFDVGTEDTLSSVIYRYLNGNDGLEHMELHAFLSGMIENNAWLAFLEKFVSQSPSIAVKYTLKYGENKPIVIDVTRLPTLKNNEVLTLTVHFNGKKSNFDLGKAHSAKYLHDFVKRFTEDKMYIRTLKTKLLNVVRGKRTGGVFRVVPELPVLWELYNQQHSK